MMLKGSVALAACALAVASSSKNMVTTSKSEMIQEANAIRRMLAPTVQLCGNKDQTTVPMISEKCNLAASSAIAGDWESCCTFGSQSNNKTCRVFETQGQYCNECDMNPDGTCSGLDKDDELTLSVKFTQQPEDQKCCQSCTCFGDPECVSFAGVLNMWIPCDARTANRCNPTKSACLATTSPNGHTCEWTRSDRDDATGWNMAINGSPCRPSGLDTDPLTMNMYTSGNFKIDLNLGERGIISDAYFTIRGQKYNINAQTCFDNAMVGPNYGWTGAGKPAGAKSSVDAAGTDVAWMFFDDQSTTFVRFSCTRAIINGVNGAPRLNINEVTVEPTKQSTGFCATGKIPEDNTDSGSFDIHMSCTLETPSALNACKNLVNQALTSRDLMLCGNEYCAQSAFGASNMAQCLSDIGNGESDNGWLNVYCKSINIVNPSVTVSACKQKTKGQGYYQQVTEWGRGLKSNDVARDGCGSQIAEYAIANKPPCEDGVYVDIKKNGVWTPTYFIPVSKPLCGDAITIFGDSQSANALFSSSVRLRQCDVKADPVCQNANPCASTAKIEFSLKYDNVPRKIMAAYKAKVLQCSPNSSGSTTWCLPDDSSYVPVDEVCPCPPNNGRLLLTGKSF